MTVIMESIISPFHHLLRKRDKEETETANLIKPRVYVLCKLSTRQHRLDALK